MRASHNVAVEVARGGDQPFKVRGSVSASNGVTVQVQKQYVALTSDQVLSTLRLPAESFEDLRCLTLMNSDGKPTLFYLFEMEEGFHVATFSSLHHLRHEELLLEPKNQLRKEQPGERYQVLLGQDMDGRKFQAGDVLEIGNNKSERAEGRQSINLNHCLHQRRSPYHFEILTVRLCDIPASKLKSL